MCKFSLFVIVLLELFAGSMGWLNPHYAEISDHTCRGFRSSREPSPTGFTGQTSVSDQRKPCAQEAAVANVAAPAVQGRAALQSGAQGGCRGAGWALPTLGTVTAVSVNSGCHGRLWSVVSQRISITCDTSPKAQGRVWETRSVPELISCLYFMRYWISEEHLMKELAELQSWGRTDMSAALLGSASSASSLCTGKICQTGLTVSNWHLVLHSSL